MRYFILLLVLLSFMSYESNAQFGGMFNKLKKKVEKKTEEKIEEEIEGEKEEPSEKAPKENSSAKESSSEKVKIEEPKVKHTMQWEHFDFIPGDKIIFEDGLTGEEIGEFPSRWDLSRGNAEIAKFDGENVIFLREYYTTIVPLIESKDYLPDVFTIEFDAFFMKDKTNQRYFIYLWDQINQKNPANIDDIDLYFNSALMGRKKGKIPGTKAARPETDTWRHISLAFNKRSLKLYIDHTRVLNIPNVKGNPTGLSLSTDSGQDHQPMLKNIRIAEGGKKLYQRFQTDGKIVTTGIVFESAKAVIKPESMGVINEIVKIMKDDPSVKFVIEGHTDNVGDEEMNMKLSEQRAKAVQDKFVEMGIEEKRLKIKGMGESTPVADNNTAEGRAQNRRVEFIKF